MKELSFYFFQCVNDRIQAKADEIEMYVVENSEEDKLELIIRDNGEKFDIRLIKADNSIAKKSFPAIYFLQKNSKENGGDFQMLSHNQSGNLIEITYPLKNSKRPRLGNVSAYLSMLFISHPEIHFIYSQISEKGEFLFDSFQFNKDLPDVDLGSREFLVNFNELLTAESEAIRILA